METKCDLITYNINNSFWDLPNNFSNLKFIGNGTFGHVCSADDQTTCQKVAIKKLSRPFDTKKHAQQTLREIKLLKHVKHDNIICLMDLFSSSKFSNDIKNIYIVTDCLEQDLSSFTNDPDFCLEDTTIRWLIYQLLRGLKYLHTSNIIHRDLKPKNLVIDSNMKLKIIDFGLARAEASEMTGYVVTRWYRAPELLIGINDYTKAVDIWSVGCIMAECYQGVPIFRSMHRIQQLEDIINLTGFPCQDYLNRLDPEIKDFFMKKDKKPNRADFNDYFDEIENPLAVDLLDKIFQIDPLKRITCIEALKHQYFDGLYDESDEPCGSNFDDSFESINYSLTDLKRLVVQEIETFQRPSKSPDI